MLENEPFLSGENSKYFILQRWSHRRRKRFDCMPWLFFSIVVVLYVFIVQFYLQSLTIASSYVQRKKSSQSQGMLISCWCRCFLSSLYHLVGGRTREELLCGCPTRETTVSICFATESGIAVIIFQSKRWRTNLMRERRQSVSTNL